MWLKILVLLQKNSQILNQPFIEEYRYFNFKHIVRQVYENKVNISGISILYKIFCLEQLAVKAWCLRICYKICWRVGNQSKLISWRVRSYPGNCPRNLVLYLDSYVLEVMEFWYQLGQWASFYIYEWLWFQHIFLFSPRKRRKCTSFRFENLLKSFKVGIMSLHWIECVEAWSINDDVS